MTVALALKVNDGLVLAADSASTLIQQFADDSIGVSNIYNTANKVFHLHKGLPVGAITWGAGSIAAASTETSIKDLRGRLMGNDPERPDWNVDPQSYSVEEIADKLYRFIYEELYVPAFEQWPNKPTLGFIVGGYSTGQAMAEEYRIDVLPDGSCTGPQLLSSPSDMGGGVSWNGETEALQRLLLGYGGNLPTVLQQRLGVPPDQVGPAMEIIQQGLDLPLVQPPMPIQDAIDLAEFLVETTIKFSRFTPGAPTVGGPIELAAITKHEGFKWIRRKYYYDRRLNPEGPNGA